MGQLRTIFVFVAVSLVKGFLFTFTSNAQSLQSDSAAMITAPAKPKLGVHDTVRVPAMWVEGEWMGGRYLSDVFVWGGNPRELARYMEEWTRLKRAVYLTYPYARSAGVVMSDVLKHLEKVESKSERRKYIRSRERELRQAFGDKIMDLSIYQGKVLMKLIHRQTGNDCYEIIKEMKGGITARFYQTILFFVGSNLKQKWNPQGDNTDRLIESFVQEIEPIYGPSASLR